MKTKWFRIGLWALVLTLVAGCGSGDRLVVYADPWLEVYADSMCQEFKRLHPEVEVHLKTISSEVIAQHIRYGQPVDVFLCFGSEWLDQPDFRDKVAAEDVLAPSQVVEVVEVDTGFAQKQRTFGSRGTIMMEASDRPMRRYGEQAGMGLEVQQKEVVVANFQSQAVDYLLRGWVPAGFVPRHFARMHAGRFRSEWLGPVIPSAFSVILLQNAPQPTLAAEFFALTKTEKSRVVLAKLGLLP